MSMIENTAFLIVDQNNKHCQILVYRADFLYHLDCLNLWQNYAKENPIPLNYWPQMGGK